MEPTRTRSGTDRIERAGDSAHETVDRVTQTASQYAEQIGEKAEQWLDMKDDWVEGAREYVREHPIAALGMAAAAGYLLHMITRSRD
jgi:ElaB/YqjD/DUF883 family membrane-anchored ribosome-binding protein